ncbi:LuxR C-terminal-related transcriptional regulator [Rhizobium halophilum]|uniref:LuxR C-terminal-related transcriptional regulator n=1 Tax=Rhizobium halophilum TaxID=2846852 RepID=UPI00293F75F5|nr:LuxR C-terminal-related transcriptional regulator [Rhizobium halophilum]
MVKVETRERQDALSRSIAAAGSQAEVLAAVKHAARAFEFEYVTLLAKPMAEDEFLSRLLIDSTLPADFVRQYDSSRFLAQCPILPTLFGTMLPRSWTLEDLEDEGEVPAPIRQLMRRFNVTTTVAMPLHSLEGERFLLRFDGNRSPVSRCELNELAMVSLHAFDVFEKLRRAERSSLPSPLSTRELEVLRWTAQGKTSVEIGRILSLSDHTINTHMTNAIKKLDCVNRPQLVAKALRLGLIN